LTLTFLFKLGSAKLVKLPGPDRFAVIYKFAFTSVKTKCFLYVIS